MNVERLVYMANQVCVFFESRPTEEETIAGVTDHLSRFWDPRMRSQLIAHVMAGGRACANTRGAPLKGFTRQAK